MRLGEIIFWVEWQQKFLAFAVRKGRFFRAEADMTIAMIESEKTSPQTTKVSFENLRGVVIFQQLSDAERFAIGSAIVQCNQGMSARAFNIDGNTLSLEAQRQDK